MINENFIYLGIAINLAGGLSYLISTLKGKTKPNKVTWFVWALAPLIAFFATIQQGVGVQSLLTFMAGFSPLLIFIASFVNRKAYWKISKLDIACGSLAILGLVLWQLTGTGNIAIALSILADAMAGIPTIIKSFYEPETENPDAFLTAGIFALITILTITNWSFEYYAFPIYILSICAILFLLIKFRLGPKLSKSISK